MELDVAGRRRDRRRHPGVVVSVGEVVDSPQLVEAGLGVPVEVAKVLGLPVRELERHRDWRPIEHVALVLQELLRLRVALVKPDRPRLDARVAVRAGELVV